MYSSLISCSTIHDLSVLQAWECDAMTWNVVKRLANQNRVNCLFDVIGQSDMLSLFATEKKMCLRHRGLLIRYVELVRSRGKNVRRAQRTVKNEEDKTSFSLGRSVESF